MRSGERRTRVRIERVVAGGDGLAREAEGRVVFVPGTLPGELAEVEVVAAKRDFARARLVSVLEPSPARVDAPCPALAAGCGGCDWQHVAPAAQLELKVEVVREALRRTAKLPDAPVRAGGAVPPWAYRTSMRFALDDDGGPSLRAARSNEPVEVEGCLVAHPLLAAMLPDTRLRGADEVSLRVSSATGERTAWWQPETARATRLPELTATGPAAALVERIAGTELRVSAASFFQSGPDAAELLVRHVGVLAGDALTGAGHVVDAYGGVGLFAACCAGADQAVTVVEGSPAACADARHNLAGRRAEVAETSVEDWLPSPADVVLADPSRRGLGAGAIERLDATGAPVLILVSCDPVAMARDAALLAPHHRLTDAVVLDLFPQTHHVEVVSRFERR
jgi:23S rRNA (uracil1939-C5)-methyltransferase